MDAPRDRLEELQLWDRSGMHYTRAKRNLPKRLARELLRDPAVQVAVSRGWPPEPVWVDLFEAREEGWAVDLSQNLKGTPGWKPSREAPGQLLLQAELWEAEDGSRILLFQDHD